MSLCPTEFGQRAALAPYWQATMRELGDFGLEHWPVPADLARRQSPDGATVLEFIDARAMGLGDLRATLIHGPRAEIFNVMLYPADALALPILAAEIVAFGPRIHVAVADLQAARPGPVALRASQEMESLAPLIAALPDGGDRPAWCDAYFTPGALFTRPGATPCHDALLEAYSRVVGCFAAWAAREHPSQCAPRGQQGVDEYKLHHIENSPGLTYLGRMFGAEWTTRFLHQGMYRAGCGPAAEVALAGVA